MSITRKIPNRRSRTAAPAALTFEDIREDHRANALQGLTPAGQIRGQEAKERSVQFAKEHPEQVTPKLQRRLKRAEE